MADSQDLPQMFSYHVDELCTPTGAQGSAVRSDTTPTLFGMQQEAPRTPVRPPVDLVNEANLSSVSSLSSLLAELDGDIVREDPPSPSPCRTNKASNHIVDLTAQHVSYTMSTQAVLGEIDREDFPIRSPTRTTRTSDHIADPTAPQVNYTVSPKTGLARVKHELSPTRAQHFRTEWSNDRNRIICEQIQDLDRVLSNGVREMLTEWHDFHSDTKPPCAYTHGNRLPPSYKVFDRDGEEHEISEIKVSVHPRQADRQSSPSRKATVRYKTLILHSEDGPDELVTIINRRKPDREKKIALFVDSSKVADTFLVVWLGPKEEFEPEPCAVVVETVDGDRVKFRPDWFDDMPRASIRKASPKKRPVSRSPAIQAPHNAVFGPELAGTPPSSVRSPSSSPCKTPKTPDHGLSTGRADSDDLIKSPSRPRKLEMSPAVNRGYHATTSPSTNQDPGSQLLVCGRVSYEINCISGTQRVLPWHLFEVLQQWHNAYPLHAPPCAVDWISHHASFQQGFSHGIFDRNGSSCEVFCFELIERRDGPIRQQRQYHVLVLRQARGPDVLIRARDRIYLDNGQVTLVFLDPWLGLHVPLRFEACAVKICDRKSPPTAFSAEMFDLASKHAPQNQRGISAQDQRSTAMQTYLEGGGNRRRLPMLLPHSAVNFSGASYESAPSQSCNITGDVSSIQSTAAPSAISLLSKDPQTSSEPGQSHLHRIQSVRRLFGREEPMQSYIRNQLEEWHYDHGGNHVPYHLRITHQSLETLIACSVFDRTGAQREFSVFSIFVSSDDNCADQDLFHIPSVDSVSYSVVVLHTETQGDKLVTLVPPITRKEGSRTQYLLAWHGPTKQFETDVCAIVVHWNAKEPVFSPALFDEAISWSSSWVAAMRESHPAKNMTAASDLRLRQIAEGPERLATINQSPKAKKRIQERSSRPSGSMSPPKRKPEDSPNESGAWPRSADNICQSPSINLGLRAKFVSETSDSVRIFSLAGCDVETIFRKAKEFYKDRDPTREFVLAWKIPGMEGERYVWEGCQDEYNILCEDLQRLSIGDDAFHEVEIRPLFLMWTQLS